MLGGKGDSDLLIRGPSSRYGGLDGATGNDTLDLAAVGKVRVEFTSDIRPSTVTSLRLFSIDGELGSTADYDATLSGIENTTLSRFDDLAIPPFLMGSSRRIHAAVFSFMAIGKGSQS